MTAPLAARAAAALDRPIQPAVADCARRLGEETGALAVLFYGSNLRTGSLEGVLDFYVLLPGERERGLWPRVSYREWDNAGTPLRSKIATMTLATFEAAAAGETLDTTIWARFVQPSALPWSAGKEAEERVLAALEAAAMTAARLAVAQGPAHGHEAEYWRALFRATYRAELRVEPPGREESILEANRSHFDGLLPAALSSAGLPFRVDGATIEPRLDPAERRRILAWWSRRRSFDICQPCEFDRYLSEAVRGTGVVARPCGGGVAPWMSSACVYGRERPLNSPARLAKASTGLAVWKRPAPLVVNRIRGA